MNYLEKVLNDRIEELKKKKQDEVNKLKDKLNQDRLDCMFDINYCYLVISDKETRIEELERLKKGLGLVPVEETKDSDD